MARIDDLLLRVSDSQLRAELTSAVAEVRRTKDFGLVFESHLPETGRLPSHPVRRGVKVTERAKNEDSLYLVASINGPTAKLVPLRDADGIAIPAEDQTPVELSLAELVVVAEFGDPIYPGLRSVGSVRRGGDKPAHVVINGENHHALEALRFTHAGKVDCIYLDPPYNAGRRDWKYNNNYVDEADIYRHSKWLAFMERRLKLAKRLLNPEKSVLIVTIDEKEYLRLGLLLEQLFEGAYIEMVTSIISAKGAYRRGHFSRVEEHIFFVSIGDAAVRPWVSNMLPSYRGVEDAEEEEDAAADDDLDPDEIVPEPIEWLGLRRREPSSVRGSRPNQFYAIFVNEQDGTLHSISHPIDDDVDRETVEVPEGTVALWPLKPDGAEMLWGLTPDVLRRNWAEGWARVNNWKPATKKGTVQYLPGGTIDRVRSGAITITGRASNGSVEGYVTPDITQGVTPKRVWHLASHNAETGGTNIVSALVPGRRFPYPKSLYAVEDTVRFVVGDKPDAVVLDFFGGSGTTVHAVMRLNRQDQGSRQSILVTNNEVSEREAARLTADGFGPGDPEWETIGIFQHVTRPRIEAAVTGMTHRGTPARRKYNYVDEFALSEGFEENVDFFELTYQDAAAIELDLAFEAIAPLLWLRAGAQGSMITSHSETGFAWTDRYGVLWDTDRWRAFISAAPDAATTAFIVTDSATAFTSVVSELPAGIEPVRLYENYLTTFAINQVEPD
jgi:adenine-specific DNA-methyltransferase